MNRHWAYLKAVCRHKWFVFLACLQVGVPIVSAVIHDWDKFLPRMWGPYSRYFYSGVDRKPEGELDFDVAWNGHQKLNKHHHQYWVLREDSGAVKPLPMPDRHRREMIADWIGAGHAYVKDWTPLEPRKWYEKNKDKMVLHPDTREWVETTLLRLEREWLMSQRGPYAPQL